MGKSNDTINTICKFMIALLIIMIFLPPFFRYVYSSDENVVKETNTDQAKYLRCSRMENVSDNTFTEEIVAKYDNNKFSTIKYTFSLNDNLDSEILSESKINLEYQELKIVFEKVNSGVTDNVNKVFSFDVSKNNYESTILSSYKKESFDNQKEINEEKGFDCSKSN